MILKKVKIYSLSDWEDNVRQNKHAKVTYYFCGIPVFTSINDVKTDAFSNKSTTKL